MNGGAYNDLNYLIRCCMLNISEELSVKVFILTI